MAEKQAFREFGAAPPALLTPDSAHGYTGLCMLNWHAMARRRYCLFLPRRSRHSSAVWHRRWPRTRLQSHPEAPGRTSAGAVRADASGRRRPHAGPGRRPERTISCRLGLRRRPDPDHRGQEIWRARARRRHRSRAHRRSQRQREGRRRRRTSSTFKLQDAMKTDVIQRDRGDDLSAVGLEPEAAADPDQASSSPARGSSRTTSAWATGRRRSPRRSRTRRPLAHDLSVSGGW